MLINDIERKRECKLSGDEWLALLTEYYKKVKKKKQENLKCSKKKQRKR